jgi:Cysteine-rich secretory protein family
MYTNEKASLSRSARGLVLVLLTGIWPAYASPYVKPAPPRRTPIVVGPTLYSIGNPSDLEQQYLEYINRARLAPSAEAVRLSSTTNPNLLALYAQFGINIPALVTQLNTIAPAAPLSFNSKLIAAARAHSLEMATRRIQTHTGTNGSSPTTRISAQGYAWSAVGENVQGYAGSVLTGHASLEVDFGISPTGMQTPPGHRNNIHGNFREIGIGVAETSTAGFGPQVVTQDFATSTLSPQLPFITGVAYYDFNGNGFYDPQEGLAGAKVSVGGAKYYAITSDSGGYSIPVPSNGNYPVTFSASNLPSQQSTLTVSSLKNVKLDWVPSYSPAIISGPTSVKIGQSAPFTYTPIGAAKSHQLREIQIEEGDLFDGADTAADNFNATLSPGYLLHAAGAGINATTAFHLAHANVIQIVPATQILSFKNSFIAKSTSLISFSSKLMYATSTQVARLQLSNNGGASWQDLWSQPGAMGTVETVFTPRTFSLSAYADQEIHLRFVYEYLGGSYYGQSDAHYGVLIDDIALTGVFRISSDRITELSSAQSLTLQPSTAGDYALTVRGQIGPRWLSWGPLFRVAVSL